MIKEITVAGIKLNNYTVLENLIQIGENMGANLFTSIQEISMNHLLLAQEDVRIKNVIESVGITVIAETGILDAVGQTTIFRKHEIENREFFFQLMRLLERNKFSVYVLAETVEELDATCEYLEDEFSRLRLVGRTAMEENTDADEKIVNEINMLAPDMILSILPSPRQEYFFEEYKSMFGAKIWYAVGSGKIISEKLSFGARVMKYIGQQKLKSYVKKEEIQNHKKVESEDDTNE